MTTTPTDQPFVPLTAASVRRGESAEQLVSVLSQPGHTQSFKPLPTAAPTTSHTGHGTQPCDPRVSIQREGDQVTGIRIHCGCGQVIDLACIY